MADNFEMMYSKYFDKLPDKDAYIKRIGLENEKIPLTKKGLDRVQFANLCAIPFENLDIFDYHVKFDLGTDEMFDKLIMKHRGGYCFELNAIYMELLEAIGFEVYPVGVRILLGRDKGNIPPIAHRASIVTLGNRRYFTDVGYGLSSAPGVSICIDEYNEQDVLGDIYTVEDRPYNTKVIIQHKPEGPSEMFMFVPDPFNRLDFVAYNTAMQLAGYFHEKRMVNLRKPGGSISIDGDTFRRTQGNERIETTLKTGAEVLKVLIEEFGMLLTGPLGDVAYKEDSQL